MTSASMCRSIGPGQSGPVEHERHRQVLQSDIVNQLVVASLQKGRIDGHDGTHPLDRKATRYGDSVLLGDANVDVTLRKPFFELDEL